MCLTAGVIRPFRGLLLTFYMNITDVILTPAQREAADKLIQEIPGGGVFVLRGAAGMGKTTILKKLQAARGGTLLNTREFLAQLETRHPLAMEEAFLNMPDEEARAAILREHLERLAGPIGGADPAELAAKAEGLTGADLKRVVEDGKVLFAYDKVRGFDLRPAEEYFLAAIETVRANKRCYEEAVRRARERRKEPVETRC